MARGHFHERVGESPRRYENFGTSGSAVAFSFRSYGRLKKKCRYKKICNSKTLLLLKLYFGQHFTERAQCIITHVIYMDIYPYQYRAKQKRMSSSNNICALLGFLCTAKQRGNLLTQCFFNLFYLSDCYRDICKKQCLGTS